MNRVSRAFTLLLVLPLLFACDQEDNPSDVDGELIKLTSSTWEGVETKEINVGVNEFRRITATVTKDATGQTFTFETTDGNFNGPNSGVKTATTVIDIRGMASILWFPPTIPGISVITGKVSTISSSIDVRTNAVPAIVFEPSLTLEDTIDISTNTLFTITVAPEWANSPIEIKTTNGTLYATGTALANFEEGKIIKPYLDQNGVTQFVFSAPTAPDDFIVITATLFGTVNSVSFRSQ